MSNDSRLIFAILRRIDHSLSTHRERSGDIQRSLDEDSVRLEDLYTQIESRLAKLESLRIRLAPT